MRSLFFSALLLIYIYIRCYLEIKIILHLPFYFPEHSQLIIMISISTIIIGAVKHVVFMRHIFSHFMIMIMIIIIIIMIIVIIIIQ